MTAYETYVMDCDLSNKTPSFFDFLVAEIHVYWNKFFGRFD